MARRTINMTLNRAGEWFYPIRSGLLGFSLVIGVVAFIVALFAAWIQHIITSFNMLSDHWVYVVVMILGLVVPPLGVLHGVLVWFGAVPS